MDQELFDADKQESLPEVQLWADGSCLMNPGGAGGWAYVLKTPIGSRKEGSGFIPAPTTNNRAEWMAIIEGLKALKKKCRVIIITDSMICVQAINGVGKKLHKRANQDLVQEAIKLASKHAVKAEWVKGHSGVADNERCDHLAFSACFPDSK